jgi:hypothetical protein
LKQSDEEFYTSHSGLALVGLALNRFTSLSSALAAMDAPADLISGIDIIRSYCALLAQGKSDFVAVEQYRNDDFFREALGNKSVPSEGTMRQRMDEHADRISFRHFLGFNRVSGENEGPFDSPLHRPHPP